jgi:hypothetical protein
MKAALFVALGMCAMQVGVMQAQNVPARPRVFLVDPAKLVEAKEKQDPALFLQVRQEADAALKTPPLSVMDKTMTPPSGDKHDYVSMALYWWPNPGTKDHLPYVRKDGEANPEVKGITDRDELKEMAVSAHALALGWYLTGNQAYAEHAALLLRTWFVNPATAMHPDLKYAAFVPGMNDGRGAGLIDSVRLIDAVDAIGLLAGSPAWTADDQAACTDWFRRYLEWITVSGPAKHEAATPHNHGSWFAVYAASMSRFVGKDLHAMHIGEAVRDQRIPDQIDGHGMQKYEMERTKSFSYSAFNLDALTQLAIIEQPLNVDLYKAGDGAILRAIDALMPYDLEHPWPHEQIQKGRENSLCPALVRAAAHTGERKYVEAQARFGCKANAEWMIEQIDLKPAS